VTTYSDLPFIFDSGVKRAIRRLKSTKTVSSDDIVSFIIKVCSEIFVSVLKHILNLGLSNGGFPSLWKETTVVPMFTKGSSVLETNYRPISLLNNFSKVLKLVFMTSLPVTSNQNYILLNVDLINLNQL
jgi:hypothetical protein